MKNKEESFTGHRSSCCVYMYHHQRRPSPWFGRPLRYRPDARRESTKPKRSLILLTHQPALFESHSHSIQFTTPCIHINSIFICSYLHFHHSPIHHPSTPPDSIELPSYSLNSVLLYSTPPTTTVHIPFGSTDQDSDTDNRIAV